MQNNIQQNYAVHKTIGFHASDLRIEFACRLIFILTILLLPFFRFLRTLSSFRFYEGIYILIIVKLKIVAMFLLGHAFTVLLSQNFLILSISLYAKQRR